MDDMVSKGFGVAILGIGSAIALESMQDVLKKGKQKKKNSYDFFPSFPKIKW